MLRVKPEKEQILDRSAALTAILAVAAFDYGLRILLFSAIAAAVSMLTELVCLYLRHEAFRLRHLDAAVNGVLIFMMMPPTVSVSLLIMSCVFAIIIGRQVFGGRNQPLFPTAAVGYCFAFLNSSVQMQTFPLQKEHLPLFSAGSIQTGSGLSYQWNTAGTFPTDPLKWLTGPAALPVGSVSVLLLLTVGAVLFIRRSASAPVLLPMVAVVAAGFTVLHLFRAPLMCCTASMLTNQMLFSALFLYADPMYAPKFVYGLLFGLLCGILIVILTGFFAVADSPVFLAVLTAPLAFYLRQPENTAARKGDDRSNETHKAEGNTVSAQESAAQ